MTGDSLNGMKILASFNTSRAFKTVYGLLYLLIGIIFPIIVSGILLFSLKSIVNSAAGSSVVLEMIPSFVPIAATIGCIGVAYLFSTDRSNGVYEYLIATGQIKISDIFLSFSLVTVAVVSLLLAIDISGIFVMAYFTAPSLLIKMFEFFAVFSIPVAYISALLSILAMLSWTAMSKVYPGVNAPGGIGSIIGIMPAVVFLIVIIRIIKPSDIILIAGLFSLALLVILILLLMVVIKRMSNETMLA
ncbi:MAG: hypothetical protein ACP5OC_08615 [Thermoplasmata archaeon]